MRAGVIAQWLRHLPCMRLTRVWFLHPSRRAQQATKSILPARQSLASYSWHIRYAKNSNNKSHNGNVTGACSSKLMSNRMTVIQWYFNSTVGRAFALHKTNPGSIPPSLSESPASYREYPARTAEPDKLPMVYSICQKTVTSLTMETLLVPTRANRWTTGWQWQWQW